MSANAVPEVRYGTIDYAYGTRLATTPPDEDGPVWMVNLMQYRERAEYVDGRDSRLSGREADDAYAPLESLTAVGAQVVFLAEVDAQLLGDAPNWDRIAVVRYPTRRAFIDMQSRADFVDKHAHKEAGMERTIVLGCQPMITPELPPAPATVPHPATDDDGPVVVLHVIRFADSDDADRMNAYEQVAASVALPHGLRIAGWFAVEGTIVGDGRAWHQARFNAFPSRAAFMAVATDPERLRAQAEHRERAIADTYALILRPTINRLSDSF